jgi:hypothetical protein
MRETLMKTSYLFLSLCACAGPLLADPLTQADREELRERLKAIQEGAQAHQEKRFASAVEDFRAALQNEDAAMALYLKCVEQADFIEQQKRGQDFRDWKRDNEGRLKNPAFRQALRFQLNWLALSMRAAARPAEVAKLAPEAQDALRAIFANAKSLAGQRELLSRSVFDSVFARTYNISESKLKNWPSSPMQVGAIFDQVIMPPLRKPDSLPALSAAWDSRIQMEAARVEEFSGNNDEPNGLTRRETVSPEMATFREEALPQLQWRKQVDLFQCGDQRAAALRMLSHINDNLTNPNAPTWIEEFQQLANPQASPAEGGAKTTPSE